MHIDEWNGLYPSKWKGLIVEDAFAHPAKYSSKLIRKIYDHMIAEGWLEPGMTVVDPFGGVALGALDCMRVGCRWRGMELEERFVKWGNENIALWNEKFSVLPRWSGDAVLLQGDSRFDLPKLLGADGCVSSPPFSSVLSRDNVSAEDRRALADEKGILNTEHVSPIDMEKIGKRSQGHYAGIVSSPPYAAMQTEKNSQSIDLEKQYAIYKKSGGGQSFEAFCKTQQKHSVGYSSVVSSPPYGDARIAQEGGGNEENMRRSNDRGRYTVVSSPPYADSVNNPQKGGIDWEKAGRPDRVERSENRHGLQGETPVFYGSQSAQMGGMKATDKGFQASISIPPFQATQGGVRVTATEGPLADKELFERHAAGNMNSGYGDSDGNMGIQVGDDFWISARLVVEQVYQLLLPGAHAVWVLKDYVKGGERIPYCDQWRQLCEAVGFVTVHEHHAMLVRNRGVSSTDMTTGEVVSHEKSAKSFFRRLAEKKGSPKIDYETILCMVKP